MARQRIDTSGEGSPLVNKPFAGLDVPATSSARAENSQPPIPAAPTRRGTNSKRNRGRVDVVRQTAGRGGKTVTVLTGFKGIAAAELQQLAREIQRACGVGGTVKPGTIEIQGDQREQACSILERAGFRPVRAGG